MAFGDASELIFKIKAETKDAVDKITGLRGTIQKEVAAITGTSGFGAIPNPAALAVTAITSIVGASIAAGSALFALTKHTADAGSEIFDLKTRMGLSAEATSALKFAVDQTDASMQQMAQGVTILKKTLSEGARGSDEAKAKLTRLGIDPQEGLKDLEGTLAKVFKVIYDAPKGLEQASAAQDAFGKSGDRLIGVVDQAEGDLRKLMQTAKDLGITFSEADAKASDDFNDALTVLEKQIKAIGYSIGKEAMPAIGTAIQDVSRWLKANKDEWPKWGATIKSVVGETVSAAQSVAVYLDKIFSRIRAIYEFNNRINAALQGGALSTREIRPGVTVDSQGNIQRSSTRAVIPYQSNLDDAAQAAIAQTKTSSYNYTGGGKSGGGGKAKDTTKDEYNDALKASQEFTDELIKQAERRIETAEREFKLGIIPLQEYYDAVADEQDLILRTKNAHQDREKELAEQYVKDQRDLSNKLQEIQSQRDDSQRAYERDREKLDETDFNAKIERQRQRAGTQLRIAAEFDKRNIETKQYLAEQGKLTYEKAEKDIGEIQLAALDRERQHLLMERDLYAEGTDLYKQFSNDLAVLEVQRGILRDTANDRVQKGREKDLENERRYLDRLFQLQKDYEQRDRELQRQRIGFAIRARGGEPTANQIGRLAELDAEQEAAHRDAVLRQLRIDEQADIDRAKLAGDGQEKIAQIERNYQALREQAWIEFNDRVREINRQAAEDVSVNTGFGGGFLQGSGLDAFVGKVPNISKQIGGVLGGAFKSLAGGIGQAVNAWTLLGSQADINVRKMAASVLAGVAAQAATMAVFHFAIGLAALTPWGFALYGSPGQWFASAAMMATVAAGAAIGGRLAAGSSFQTQPSAQGAQTSVAGAVASTQPKPVERIEDRGSVRAGTFQPQVIVIKQEVEHKITVPHGWVTETLLSGHTNKLDNYVAEVIRAKMRQPGELRNTVRNTAEGTSYY